MSTPSPLYPIQNESRAALTLDGLWRFQFDPRAEGEAAGWPNGLPAPISMPVRTGKIPSMKPLTASAAPSAPCSMWSVTPRSRSTC